MLRFIILIFTASFSSYAFEVKVSYSEPSRVHMDYEHITLLLREKAMLKAESEVSNVAILTHTDAIVDSHKVVFSSLYLKEFYYVEVDGTREYTAVFSVNQKEDNASYLLSKMNSALTTEKDSGLNNRVGHFTHTSEFDTEIDFYNKKSGIIDYYKCNDSYGRYLIQRYDTSTQIQEYTANLSYMNMFDARTKTKAASVLDVITANDYANRFKDVVERSDRDEIIANTVNDFFSQKQIGIFASLRNKPYSSCILLEVTPFHFDINSQNLEGNSSLWPHYILKVNESTFVRNAIYGKHLGKYNYFRSYEGLAGSARLSESLTDKQSTIDAFFQYFLDNSLSLSNKQHFLVGSFISDKKRLFVPLYIPNDTKIDSLAIKVSLLPTQPKLNH